MGVLARRTAAAFAVLMLGLGLVGCSGAPAAPSPSDTPSTAVPSQSVSSSPDAVTDGPTVPVSPAPPEYPDADTLAPASATTGLPTITVQELPAQAVETLRLIKDGGPFPFPRDGLMFQNRERRLPEQPPGFYHEYTVATPGATDRGARRLVTGADGSRFWTADHYESFQEVIAPWS